MSLIIALEGINHKCYCYCCKRYTQTYGQNPVQKHNMNRFRNVEHYIHTNFLEIRNT